MMAGGAVQQNGIFSTPHHHSQQPHMEADPPDSRKRPLETPTEASSTKRTNTGGKSDAGGGVGGSGARLENPTIFGGVGGITPFWVQTKMPVIQHQTNRVFTVNVASDSSGKNGAAREPQRGCKQVKGPARARRSQGLIPSTDDLVIIPHQPPHNDARGSHSGRRQAGKHPSTSEDAPSSPSQQICHHGSHHIWFLFTCCHHHLALPPCWPCTHHVEKLLVRIQCR